jgi:hypothetical protein
MTGRGRAKRRRRLCTATRRGRGDEAAITPRRCSRAAAACCKRTSTPVRRLRQPANPRRAGGPATLAFCWAATGGPRPPSAYCRQPSHGSAAGQQHDRTRGSAADSPARHRRYATFAREAAVRRRRRKPANGAGRESRRAVARAPSIGCAGAPSLGRGQCRGPRKSSTTRCASSSAAKIGAPEAIDALFGKGLTLREARRVKGGAQDGPLGRHRDLGRLRLRVPTLARPQPHTCPGAAGVHRPARSRPFPWPARLRQHAFGAIALGVEAVKAGRSVYFCTLAELINLIGQGRAEGSLRERLRFLCRPQLLIMDEVGYLAVVPGGGNLLFQLVNARYARHGSIGCIVFQCPMQQD